MNNVTLDSRYLTRNILILGLPNIACAETWSTWALGGDWGPISGTGYGAGEQYIE